MTARPAIFTIPPGADFARSLARGLLARLDKSDPFALSRATIYLPTQRAARVFGDAFAAEAGGAALLPDFRPLGDVDEDEMLFDSASDAFELVPAIAPARRRFLLATLVRQWHAARKDPISFAQASALAKGLAALLDDMERQNATLADLDGLVEANLAGHWLKVTEFLAILKEHWPHILAAEEALNPIDRRNRALAALAARFAAAPPPGFVLAAGSTGSIPATANLLSVIARLPQGAVVLPGLDQTLDRKSWDSIADDPGHPQFGMKQLLARMGALREDVKNWDDSIVLPRTRLLGETLRPAPATDAWQKLVGKKTQKIIADGLAGLSLIEASDPAEEARIITLLLRETLEDKTKTGALITPDRSLGRRVAAELRRFAIAIDDSGGTPLAHTAPGAFLCLLAEAAEEAFAPVKFLALLKHPLCANGEQRQAFLARARQLDRVLRGPRPDPGLKGIAAAIERAREEKFADLSALDGLARWFVALAGTLAPLADLHARADAPLGEILEAHLKCADALARNDKEQDLLWRGPAGSLLAAHVDALLTAAQGDLVIDVRSYAALFRALAEEKNLRPPYGGHPRLSILGPLEARLLSFDRVVLGGLNEGTWPRHPAPDPWFSRPMRKSLGLEQPEREIGLSAHDFAQSAAGGEVFLTRALKADGTPTVASRWVQRLVQLTRGLKLKEKLNPPVDYAEVARALAAPSESRRMKPPYPCPPVAARPRALSVTQVENWMRDPYAIYARHVLRLRKLDPLEAEIGPLERGNTLHRILENFVRDYPGPLPPEAGARLIAIADRIFREDRIPQASLAVWRPRFLLAVPRLIGHEMQRRESVKSHHVETRGEWRINAPGGDFTLSAIADRIDVLKSGGAVILDYKSGTPPTPKRVKAFLSPQLLLEGVILRQGGFPEAGKHHPVELTYIGFGGKQPGEFLPLDIDVAAFVDRAEREFVGLVARYDDPSVGYPSHTIPIKESYEGDYDHLARVREWSLSGRESE